MRRVVFLLLLTLTACTNLETEREILVLDNFSSQDEDSYGISRTSTELTPEDAAIVASIKRYGRTFTKTNLDSTVEGVEPIVGDDGQTLMYVVSYQDLQGYTVISAKKSYYPILVEVFEGQYDSLSISQTGASLYFEMYREEILSGESKKDDEKQQIRREWACYEEKQDKFDRYTKSQDDDLIDLVEESIAEWEAAGYEYYFLDQGKPDIIPQEVFDDWVQRSREQANENYDYMANSVILIQSTPPETNLGPLLGTAWGQFWFTLPGNSSLGSQVIVGCGPVAVGQIMAYHGFPTTYNWSRIRIDYVETTNFLKELALEMCDIESFGENFSVSNILQMQDILNAKGYLTTLQNHDAGGVRASIQQRSPVLMTGRAPRKLYGHAWVCDGIHYFPVSYYCTLKILSYFDPMTYETAGTYQTSIERPSYYHMNWGNNGSGNGFYLDTGHQYIQDRQDLTYILPGQIVFP